MTYFKYAKYGLVQLVGKTAFYAARSGFYDRLAGVIYNDGRFFMVYYPQRSEQRKNKSDSDFFCSIIV